ncbi:hypothetical protein [Corynebacterium sp. HMSC22B11]|uniref:hypothetical protein n=1 Tax=Corynebacterium sp. HMSC22B11 TaxID=1581056 RepID=UPI0008A4DB4D|nr:hypothetical protein [Corynebacterium sp. HMSC22B11]
MASVLQQAVAEAVVEQSWWKRRKDSLAAVAGMLLQVTNLEIFNSTSMPVWASILIAVIIGACQTVIHAYTLGAITPSMGTRLEQAAEKAHMTRPQVSGITVSDTTPADPTPATITPAVDEEDISTPLPVYEGATSDEYVGAHRAEDRTPIPPEADHDA